MHLHMMHEIVENFAMLAFGFASADLSSICPLRTSQQVLFASLAHVH